MGEALNRGAKEASGRGHASAQASTALNQVFCPAVHPHTSAIFPEPQDVLGTEGAANGLPGETEN